MNLGFRHAFRTDVGKCRDENQDSHGSLRTNRSDLYIVADGMGGARGGALASVMAVNIILKLSVLDTGQITEESLRAAVEQANADIFERSQNDESLSGMGTTVVAIAFCDKKTFIAHVGDSRAYLYRGGELHRLTRDHTLVQELVDSGSIEEEHAEDHPYGHMLTRSLGPVGAVDIEVATIPYKLEVEDKFLLCCDGLFNHVSDDAIRDVLSRNEPDMAADVLVNLANQGGGSDNITVEVIEVEKTVDDAVSQLEDGKVESYASGKIPLEDINGASSASSADSDESYDDIDVSREESSSGISSDKQVQESGVSVNGQDSIGVNIEQCRERLGKASSSDLDIGNDGKPEGYSEFKNLGDASAVGEVTDLQKFQIFAIGAVVLAVIACIYAVMPRGANVPLGKSDSITVASQASGGDGTDNSSKKVVSVVSEDSLSLTPVKPKASSASHSPGWEQFVKKTVEQDFGIEGGPTQAWPTVSVIPKEPKEQKGTTATQKESATKLKSTSSATDSSKQSSHSEKSLSSGASQSSTLSSLDNDAKIGVNKSEDERVKAIARIIAQASDFSVDVPPVTDVKVATLKRPTNQPIIWEHEKPLRNKFLSQTLDVKQKPEETFDEEPSLLNLRDKAQVSSDKVKLREKIANIDSKLRSYSLSGKEAVKGRTAEIEKQLQLVAQALVQTEADLSKARERYHFWLKRKGILSKGEPLKVVDKVSAANLQVKRTKEVYDIAVSRHQEMVSLWEANPKDDSFATQVSALGREKEKRLVALVESMRLAIETAIELAKFDLSESALVKEDLRRRQDRLNRYVGYVKVHGTLSFSGTSMTEQRKLMNSRRKLVSELDKLRRQFSDQEEIELRREAAFDRLGL